MPETTPEDTFDQDIAATYRSVYKVEPAGPEEFFRLGQLVPDASNIGEAISKLYSLPAESIADVLRAFPHIVPRPFQGSVFPPEELETIRAEQVPRIPTHRNLPVYVDNPSALTAFRWFDLADFEQHPSRQLFRDQTGHGQPRPVREVPFSAFMTFACRLGVIDWTETLLFVELFEKPNEQKLAPLSPEVWVRFIIAYTRMPLPFEGGTELPAWLQTEIEQYQNGLRQSVPGVHPHHLR